jgi:hypothetical protein
MGKANQPVERRKHRRFEIPVGAFIVLGPDSTKVGRITDISMGGLAFRHVDKKEPSDGLHELDMFHIHTDFCLKHVPFDTVWDAEEAPGGFMTISGSGLRFRQLTDNQKSQLQRFIQDHAVAGG